MQAVLRKNFKPHNYLSIRVYLFEIVQTVFVVKREINIMFDELPFSMHISVREFTASDIQHIVDYFLGGNINFLRGMGADKALLPERELWIENIRKELIKPDSEKSNYYVIWLLNDQPVGHSNVNNIQFGETATMHLHLWKGSRRKSGLGFEFLKLSIPFFFEKFRLKKIICEPYAENIAPNRTLQKLGFELVKTYETIPGPISFQQVVNRYELENSINEN